MKQSANRSFIVPYRPGYATALSEMVCKNFKEVNSRDYPPEEIQRLVNTHQSDGLHALACLGKTYVALQNEIPVGMVTLVKSQDEPEGVCYLHNFFVSSVLHRQGIGTQLLRCAEQEAKELHASRLALYASRTARDFYLSRGFFPVVEQEDENGLLRMENELFP